MGHVISRSYCKHLISGTYLPQKVSDTTSVPYRDTFILVGGWIDNPNPVYLDTMWMFKAWLPDGYSQIFRIACVWPFGLLDYGSATLRCKI